MGSVTELERMRAGQARMDQEAEERQALERTLKPFNPHGFVYDKGTVIRMGVIYAEHYLGGGAGLGMCLVLLEEHEDATTLSQVMKEHYPWIDRRTYQRMTRFARFCAKSSKFMAIFGRRGMMNKGLALLEGLKDPEIDELLIELDETGEVKGLTEADLLGKTYRQTMLENKRLRLETNKKVEAATEKLSKENLRLKKQNEELREEAGMSAGLEKEIAKLEAGEALINEGVVALGRPDWVLLSQEAGGRARAKLLIDKLGRVAQWLGDLLEPGKK